MSRRGLERLINDQPLGSLAYPELTGRQRALTIEYSGKCTIADARQFLAYGTGSTNLANIFTTELRCQQLASAMALFDKTVDDWKIGEQLRDQRFAWILPDQLSMPFVESHLLDFTAYVGSMPLTEQLVEIETWRSWLPYVALETINEFRHLRNSDYALITIVMARAFRRLGLGSTARPWQHHFWPKAEALPTAWLFQFEPTSRVSRILDRLLRSGLVNIGHLIVLQPQAWTTIRARPAEEWRALQRALKRAAP